MPIESDGRFSWPDDQVYDGVRQSASESILRYRRLQNMNLFRREALTKDRGILRIHTTDIDSSNDLLGGFDAHFLNGNQKVVVVSTTDAHLWNTTTEEFDAQSQSLANAKPDMLMFADKLYVMNGTQFNSMTSAGTWTTAPGGGLPAAPKFGNVHAERLCVAGVSGNEHLFYPSGIRNATTFDTSLSVIVETPADNAITNLGTLGHLQIVQTREATKAYYLGTDNPRDWDQATVSHTVGCTAHDSWTEVSRGRGDNRRHFAFFWSDEGPMMMADQGGANPQLVSLWEPIYRAVRGEAFQDFPALEISRFGNVVSAYCPEFNQVRFGVTKLGDAENNLILCVDVDSAIDLANGQREYAIWSIRDNSNLSYFPSDIIFPIRVDTNGRPSVTGQNRCFCGRDGVIYEMDARATYKDLGTTDIPIYARKAGYDGARDGIRNHTKSPMYIHIRATQVGGATLKAKVIADGGQLESEATIALDKGLDVWGGTTWNGGKWNGGEFVTERGDFGVNGQRFDLELYDEGNISEEFQIDGWELSGYIEDRR